MRSTDDMLRVMALALNDSQGRLENGKLVVFYQAYDHIEALQAEIERLREAIREAYEGMSHGADADAYAMLKCAVEKTNGHG